MFGTFAASTASVIFSASLAFIARGFSQRIILPAFAAAMAISAWTLFGAAMSIRSMSERSISFFQSVSTEA